MRLPKVRIAAAQAPEIHKDIPRALEFLNTTFERAKAQQAHLLAFPEGFLQGYIVEEQQAREIAIDLTSHPMRHQSTQEKTQHGPTIRHRPWQSVRGTNRHRREVDQ